MGEYVSLDMGCTWEFESPLFNYNPIRVTLFACRRSMAQVN